MVGGEDEPYVTGTRRTNHGLPPVILQMAGPALHGTRAVQGADSSPCTGRLRTWGWGTLCYELSVTEFDNHAAEVLWSRFTTGSLDSCA
jgi:hypothetical protein